MVPEFSEELWQNLKKKLKQSDFRKKFELKEADLLYVRKKGFLTLREHAKDFIAKRLAPSSPLNDGKQTPMKGHPVFIAQHATATCCRKCLYKWHNIPPGRALTTDEQEYVVNIILRWIEEKCSKIPDCYKEKNIKLLSIEN